MCTTRDVKKRSIALGLVAVLCIGGTADTLFASGVERTLSRQAAQLNGLEVAPEAYISGFPVALAAVTGAVSRVSLHSVDVPVAGVGVGNAGVELINLELPANAGQRLRRADLTGAQADVVRRTVRLDGVAFGQLLGMTDLDIAHPYDISPSGGTASEARMTGTVPGTDIPTTVVVTLRLDGPTFRMRPSQLIDVPSDLTDRVIDAYTLDRDTRDLPLGGQADNVQLSGGSIEFSRDRINTVVEAGDLAPLV